MLYAWITLLVLCHEATGFLIHNTHHSLCLEDQAGPGPGAGPGAVGLGRCNLDSRLQQWVWWNRRVLRNLGSDRCLASRGTDPARTVGCPATEEQEEEEEEVVQGAGAGAGEGGAGVVEEEMLWDCERSRLISVSSGLELSVDDDSLSPALSPLSQRSGRWRSLDEGDICQEILRSKRASREPGEFEGPSESMDPSAAMAGMTEEQKKFLIWYYRTEDPTIWKFVMLGLSFVALLVGFLLLGMGSMANKNRREIAKYKAAAALATRQPGGGGEELQTLNDFQGHNDLEAPPPAALDGAGPSQGEIVVTWRDGDVSTLYPDPLPEEEVEVEVEVEEEKEEGKGEGCMEQTPRMEESSREESLVKGECGECSDDGVQRMMNGKIE